MHIKAFLKKISDIPSIDSCNPRKHTREELKEYSPNRQKYQFEKLTKNAQQSNVLRAESAFKYLENHHPTIRAKLLKSRLQIGNSPQANAATKFRQRIQQRLTSLINQRTDLAITRIKSRKISSSSMKYSSNQSKKRQLNERIMPQFVKNIMKPCKISAISIGNRPKTGRVQHTKSQPKLYCKSLMPSKKIKAISVAQRSLTRHSLVPEKALEQQRRMNIIISGKVDGWKDFRQNEWNESVWLS